MIQIRQRPFEEEELIRLAALARQRTRTLVQGFGCASIALGIPLAWLFGWLGSKLGKLISDDGETIGYWAGIGLVVLYLGNALVYTWRLTRYYEERDRREREQGAEELKVMGAAACLLEDQRAVVFQVDDNQLLYLSGYWLQDASLYGVRRSFLDEPIEERINRLPDPHGFPCADFTLVRLPLSGRCLNIHIEGPYLDTDRAVHVQPCRWLDEVELIPGQLDQLERALKQADEQKERAQTRNG